MTIAARLLVGVPDDLLNLVFLAKMVRLEILVSQLLCVCLGLERGLVLQGRTATRLIEVDKHVFDLVHLALKLIFSDKQNQDLLSALDMLAAAASF